MNWGLRQLKVSVAITVLLFAVVSCGGSEPSETTTSTVTTVPGQTTTTSEGGPAVAASFTIYDGVFTLNGEEIDRFDTPSLEIGDEIAPDGPAHGKVVLGGEYTIEMFKGGAISLTGLRPPELEIHLTSGHIRVVGSGDTTARLKVTTSSTELETVGDRAATFTVCQPENENTCLAVERGAVELNSAGKEQIYHEREGTDMTGMFVVKDMPPEPDRCVSVQEYDDWFALARVNETEQRLGELVGDSPVCDDGEDPEGVPVLVEGTEPWTDTGFEVEAGDTLIVDATGGVQHRETSEFFGPDGDPDESNRQFNLPGLEDVNHVALIAKIGDDGIPFLIGAQYDQELESDGRLFLGVNDKGVTNNAGSFAAAVTIRAES